MMSKIDTIKSTCQNSAVINICFGNTLNYINLYNIK